MNDDVVEAGRIVLRRHGLAGATMERVAQEAGLSRVTLHRWGVTRDGILEELARRGLERYRAAMWPAMTAPGSAADRMEAACLALCDAAEEELELLVALRSRTDAVFHAADEPDGSGALTRDEFTDPFERLLRDGSADGSLRALDPREAGTVIFNLVGWTYVHLRTGHRWPATRARSATVDIALRGVLAR